MSNSCLICQEKGIPFNTGCICTKCGYKICHECTIAYYISYHMNDGNIVNEYKPKLECPKCMRVISNHSKIGQTERYFKIKFGNNYEHCNDDSDIDIDSDSDVVDNYSNFINRPETIQQQFNIANLQYHNINKRSISDGSTTVHPIDIIKASRMAFYKNNKGLKNIMTTLHTYMFTLKTNKFLQKIYMIINDIEYFYPSKLGMYMYMRSPEFKDKYHTLLSGIVQYNLDGTTPVNYLDRS
jgi:hypothetical protein